MDQVEALLALLARRMMLVPRTDLEGLNASDKSMFLEKNGILKRTASLSSFVLHVSGMPFFAF